MKNPYTTPVAAAPSDGGAAPRRGPFKAWVDFWFAPTDPIGLHVVRLLSGLLFIGWLLPFAGDLQAFFSLRGWIDLEAARDPVRAQERISLSWSLLYLAINKPALLTVFYWGALAVFALFAAGVWTRVTGVLTYCAVASFAMNPMISYEAEYLLIILAFYLMIGYLLLGQWGGNLSLAGRLLGSSDTLLLGRMRPRNDDDLVVARPPSTGANLALRLLQVHFALILVVSGLHKLQSGDWWAGVAFVFPLNRPFETTPESLRAFAASAGAILFFMSLAQYLYLAWEIGFPLFAWRTGWWRLVLVGGAAGRWVVWLFLLGQPLFGPIFFVACLSFVTAAEWRWLLGLFTRPARRAETARPLAARAAAPIKVAAK